MTSSNNANQVVSVGDCLNDWTFGPCFAETPKKTAPRTPAAPWPVGRWQGQARQDGTCAFAAVIATG